MRGNTLNRDQNAGAGVAGWGGGHGDGVVTAACKAGLKKWRLPGEGRPGAGEEAQADRLCGKEAGVRPPVSAPCLVLVLSQALVCPLKCSLCCPYWPQPRFGVHCGGTKVTFCGDFYTLKWLGLGKPSLGARAGCSTSDLSSP